MKPLAVKTWAGISFITPTLLKITWAGLCLVFAVGVGFLALCLAVVLAGE